HDYSAAENRLVDKRWSTRPRLQHGDQVRSDSGGAESGSIRALPGRKSPGDAAGAGASLQKTRHVCRLEQMPKEIPKWPRRNLLAARKRQRPMSVELGLVPLRFPA